MQDITSKGGRSRRNRLTASAASILVGLAAFASTGLATSAQAAEPAKAEASGIKQIFNLATPMRDGVTLASDVWMPEGGGKYPTILIRTPYIRNGRTASSPELVKFFVQHGYAVVVQDVRGRGDSNGTYDFFHPDAHDGYDTIEWLAAQPWSTGRVCMMGYSYMASVQWLAAKEKPPHLACIAPTSPGLKFLDELPATGGAFMQGWALKYFSNLTGRIAEGQSEGLVDWDKVYAHRPLITADEVLGRSVPIYRALLEHDTLDEYWKPIQLGPEEWAKIDIPVLTTTGWFDGDQIGALWMYEGLSRRPGGAKDNYLVIGPWTHNQSWGGGKETQGEFVLGKSSIIDNNALRLAFFDRFLKQSTTTFDQPKVRVFVSGANVWRTFEAYPIPEARLTRFYLSSGGKANSVTGDGALSLAASTKGQPDAYTYDPKNPVPIVEGKNTLPGGSDRTGIQRRQDVLVYTSAPLERGVQVIGAVGVELYAASDALDTDFVATLTDVGPDGKALLLGPRPVGIVRARYRHGPSAKPELLTPGKPELYRIDIAGIGHEFLPGHRIRIDITSSATPYFNPNQNTGNPIATDTEWKVARQKILHDKRYPSALVLPVVSSLPTPAAPEAKK
ncbi:MAG: CocE/NonD family hydrolase [Phenylobacterium sp.]